MKTFRDSPVEKYRLIEGDQATPPGVQFGTFLVPLLKAPTKADLVHPRTIALIWADDGAKTGWERVVIQVQDRVKKKGVSRPPTLPELEAIKTLFWDAAETPALLLLADHEADHVQDQLRVSLWKPRAGKFELPPLSIL